MAERYRRGAREYKNDWGRGFPAQQPSWGIGEVLLVLALVLALLFSLRLFYSYRLSALAVTLFPGYGKPSLSLQLLLSLAQAPIMIGLVLGTACLRARQPLRLLGLQNFSWRSVLIHGILGGVAVFSLIVVVMITISAFWRQPVSTQEAAYLLKGANGWAERLGSMLLASVLAPFSEELYFRGFVYPVFRNRLGVWPGVALSSCFFGALHGDLVRFLPIALGGAFFALSCEKTRSLYPAMVAHSTWNTLTTLVLFFTGSLS